ncbi:MAG: hypothetical protein WCF07_15295 [Nitrososphaeraceae archaeon]
MELWIDVVCISVLSDNISLDELIYSNRSNSNKEISFISYYNFSLVMNSKKQTTIAAVVLSSLLSIVASISGLTTSEVFGQNSTSSNLTQATGQQNTTNANSTSSNLTQAAAGPGPMGVLTQSDFGELTDNINSAREALKDNDPAGAIGDLGSAETEVRVFMTQVGGEDSPGGQQLLTVLNHINMAQDSSGNNDTLKAFQEINSADTELLKITQKLPADEDEDD